MKSTTEKIEIIERNITNEDGDFYGVCGKMTKRQAYKIIKEDLEEYGIEEDVELKLEDLSEYDFWKTTECPSGEHEGYIWWGKPDKEDKVISIGKGWGIEL